MQAQEPVSVNLSEKDGLPDKEFYDVFEDSKGFIWLCADKGLFRYDGKSFKNYSNKNKRGLSVFGAKEDKSGRIWCNNITGQFFYIENNKLNLFIDLNEELKGELADFELRDNYIFVFTLLKIFKIDIKTKKIKSVLKTKFIYGNPYVNNNEIYFENNQSVFKIKETGVIVEVFSMNLPFRDVNNKGVLSGKSQIAKIGNTLLLRQLRNLKNAFFVIDKSQNSIIQSENFKHVENEIVQYIYVNDNEAWLCTTSGIFIYEFNNDEFTFKKKILSSKNISKIIKDTDGNYWVTTLNNGIYVIPNIYIEQYAISETNKNITSLDKIDQKQLVFGATSGNVSIFNIKTNTEKIIDILSTSRVSALKYNPNKKVSYIGLDTEGFVLNHKTLKVDKVSVFSSAKKFTLLKEDELLYINFKQVIKLKQSNLKTREDISTEKRPYTSFYSKKKASTYICYVDNLVVYDSLWQPKSITYKKEPIYGLAISETTDNIVWIGSFKNGVYGIKNDTVVQHLSTKNGLASNRIEAVKADKNNLWIATSNGIQVYNIVSKNFKTLTKRDGIVSYDISGIEVFDNKVIFSSNKGLFSIDKTKVFKQHKEQDVYFNQVEINQDTLTVRSNYILNYDENEIKISFNVNGFQFNQKGKYAYRLLGLNTNWTTTETGVSSVKYNSLPSGKYTFQVKPVLDSKTLEGKIKTLQFLIKKPFWKTWWFILGSSIFILGATVLYFKYKIKEKEKERQKEVKQLSLDNELIALKLENLRSQMNPHFIFNALNSIQEYIVLNQKKMASDYLGKFADLIRTYLNHSSKGNITLKEEINCLEMYLELEKLRFEDKLHYTITVSGKLNANNVLIPTMLVQPYVENALKHGLLHRKDNRNLKVSFFISEEEKQVKCIIVDNGVGRDKAEEYKARSHKNHTSFATKATEDRLDLLNYGKEKQVAVTIIDLFENETPTGTQVNINIPFTIH